MRGVVLIALGAVALVVAAVLGPAALAGGKPKSGDERAAISRADLVGVNFVENCRYSHQAPDDPIVYPGQAGSLAPAHVRRATARRTRSRSFGSLRSGEHDVHAGRGHGRVLGAGALPGHDRDPAGRRDRLLPPRHARRGEHVPEQPAHDRRRREGDEPAGHAASRSGAAASRRASTARRRCPRVPDTRGSFLRLHIRFPECWDGRRLDSPDHKSHMAYATRTGCPSTHPVAVPQITQIYRYPTRGGEGFSLASGGVYRRTPTS